MKSFFVFMRNVNGVERFSVGVGVLPQGVRQVGCFGTITEARELRDRLRLGKASTVKVIFPHRRRGINALVQAHEVDPERRKLF